MTKKEFEVSVDQLLKEIDGIRRFDHLDALLMVDHVERFVKDHRSHLPNPYLTEHFGHIRTDLEYVGKYKSNARKAQYWNGAIRGLKSDVESMKQANSFLEKIEDRGTD